MSVILPRLLIYRIAVAFLFTVPFASDIQADSTNAVPEQKSQPRWSKTKWMQLESPLSLLSKIAVRAEEKNIAHTLRTLNKYEEMHVTNILISTLSGITVSNKLDMVKLWKFRDMQALKLVEQWEKNPKEIDDRSVISGDFQHYDFVKRLMNDKTNLRERLKNQEKYNAYKYQPYFHQPETMIFTNSQECILFVTSDYEGYRERIVPIIWELNDSNSLFVLAGMVADDQSEKVRNKAAEAWVALLMPEGLKNDQKARLLDNLIVPKMKGLTNDQKAWLANFIKSEKGLEKDGKKWAIEAAERILRKMDKEQTATNAPPEQVSGTNAILMK